MNNQGWSDHSRGVHVKPLTPDGNDVTIFYNGLLHRHGASQIFLHAGFGDPLQWSIVEEYRMQHTPEGWKKTLNMEDSRLSFCFRDTGENWDNNNGHNWMYSTS